VGKKQGRHSAPLLGSTDLAIPVVLGEKRQKDKGQWGESGDSVAAARYRSKVQSLYHGANGESATVGEKEKAS